MEAFPAAEVEQRSKMKCQEGVEGGTGNHQI